jgi:VanZ family protein
MIAQYIKTILRYLLGLKTASRLAAWACLVTVAFLSLLPAEQMKRTSLGGHTEHALAYVGTAFIVATAYCEHGVMRIVFTLFAYAGGLEFLQRFSPGRTSNLEDYFFSVIGIFVGSGTFVFLAKWLSASGRDEEPF